jgi:hypothetical protein
MSTEFFEDQWRIPSNENQNKVSNYSMDFDGTSDFIDCGDSDKFSFGDGTTDRPFSLSGWVKPDDSSTLFILVSKILPTGDNREYQFSRANSKLSFHFNSLGTYTNRIEVDTTASITSTDWQHWVATYDGSGAGTGVKIYVNGVEMTTSVSSYGTYVAMKNGTASFEIGAITNSFPSGKYANGQIDQVTVFDYALPATGTNSVATLYGGGTAVTNSMTLSPKPIYYAQLGDQSAYNGANYLVPNNSLSDFVFNFDSDSVNCGNTLGSGYSSISVSSWVNFDNPNSNVREEIISKDDGSSNRTFFLVKWRNSDWAAYGTIGFAINDGTTTSNAIVSQADFTPSANTWYNVIGTWDGANIKLYINGVLKKTTAFSASNLDTNTVNVLIGDSSASGAYFFNGQISNTAVFNTALPLTGSNSIETIYNNGAPGDISSLSPVAWYKLNAADTFDGSNWTINDYGSGGNDGTSLGMTSANLVVSDLQQTSGYSPYALDFDGVNDYLDANRTVASNLDFSVSAWIKPSSYSMPILGTRGLASAGTSNGITMNINSSGNLWGRIFTETSNIIQVQTGSIISLNNWSHVAMTYNSSTKTLKTYLNGSEVGSIIGTDSSVTSTAELNIGRASIGMVYDYFDGSISNVSIFNTELTSTQVIEIYNQGVPSNLNNFSGTAPVSWWQIGSNSSYNSGAWTCLDEIGTNNAVSVNMAKNDIVDGVGYSASGLGSSSIDIKGDAPYSTANGLSRSMDVLDRSTDIPS